MKWIENMILIVKCYVAVICYDLQEIKLLSNKKYLRIHIYYFYD